VNEERNTNDTRARGLSRRRVLRREAIIGALTAGGPLVFLLGASEASVAQTPAGAHGELGVAPAGVNAFNLIGTIDQNGSAFSAYGYLSDIAGLDPSLAFSDPSSPGEATAHFTFNASTQLSSRTVLQSLFLVTSSGQMNFFYNPSPAGDFSNSSSFAQGSNIGTGSLVFQSIINVQAQNQGIETGVGTLSQLSPNPFSIAGQSYSLGRTGMSLRLSITGSGQRTDPITPKATIAIAGFALLAADPQ